MRHGRTNYNELGLCNDDPDADVHLNETGKQQAQAAAEQLRDVALERIIVSPLPRTRQTAEVVNRYHGLPIEVHPAIADIRSGFDGQTVAAYFAAIAHDPLNARANGGESLLDHKHRVLGLLIGWRDSRRKISLWLHTKRLSGCLWLVSRAASRMNSCAIFISRIVKSGAMS